MVIRCSAHCSKFGRSFQSLMQIVTARNNIFIEAVMCRLDLQAVALVDGCLYERKTSTVASTNSV